jgi:uncharacterized protein (TIGR03435 family)
MVGGPGTGSPGRITFTAAPLKRLLQRAWGLPEYQITALSWMVGFDPVYTVTATMPPDTTEQQFRVMLQNLLTERFQMKYHYEDKTSSGYDLVVAPGGSKLKKSADPDAPDPTTGPQSGVDKDGFALLPPGHGAAIVLANGFRAKFQNYAVSEFADGGYLRSWVADANGPFIGPIRDKTGLGGVYDFTLAFDNRRPVVIATSEGRIVRGASEGVTASAPSGVPDLFTALEKQLGLRLAPVKNVPVRMLVIDSAEKMPVPD